MLFVFPMNNRERAAWYDGWHTLRTCIAAAKCFVVRKEDANNEAKPLPPANINHTEKTGGGVNTVFYDVKLLTARRMRDSLNVI